MNLNLLEKKNTLKEKFKNLSKWSKLSIITGILTILALSVGGVYYNISNQYKVLFSNLQAVDSKEILEILDNDKIKYKIQEDTIYVPKELVDELRLKLASNIDSSSGGFELMDEGLSLGMTNEEFELKKQRILQGEIEKTIKSFKEIKNARVHISEGKDSVFVTETVPKKASVYIDLVPGSSISNEQVISIISLVSGSTKDLPKQNIEVIDENMNLLSKDLYDKNGTYIGKDSSTIEGIQNIRTKFNEELEKSLNEILEVIYGAGNVKVKINTDLNLDSVEKTEIKIDPEKVLISEQISKSNEQEKDNTSNSPVDNNMNNEEDTTTSQGKNSSEETRNYELGKIETHTIVAPGKINRITTSVVVNKELSNDEISKIENITKNAIGLDMERKDSVTVVGIKFNENNENDNTTEENSKKIGIREIIIISVAGLSIVLIILILVIRRKRKLKKLEEEKLINQAINKLESKIELNENSVNEEDSIEEEVRRYVQNKPKEAAEVIKTWLK